MRIGVPQETAPGERRVALVPESCKKLVAGGLRGRGRGRARAIPPASPTPPIARPGVDRRDRPRRAGGWRGHRAQGRARGGGGRDEVGWMRAGADLSRLAHAAPPSRRGPGAGRAAGHRLRHRRDPPDHPGAVDGHPVARWPTSPATRACCWRRSELNKYFPMFMTAAGMVPPAKVFVIGAGVAGLQAIATAKRLGAHVTATDVRPEVKEQIESVGGKYVGIELKESAAAGGGYAKELSEEDQARQREILAAQVRPVGRGGHHGPHRRGVRAPADHRRHGAGDAPRRGDRGPGRRRRRQLRAVPAGRDGGGRRGHHPGPAQPAGLDAAAREPALLPQPDRVPAGLHQGQGVPAGPERRHPAGRADHPCRRGAARPHPRGARQGGA